MAAFAIADKMTSLSPMYIAIFTTPKICSCYTLWNNNDKTFKSHKNTAVKNWAGGHWENFLENVEIDIYKYRDSVTLL